MFGYCSVIISRSVMLYSLKIFSKQTKNPLQLYYISASRIKSNQNIIKQIFEYLYVSSLTLGLKVKKMMSRRQFF